MEPNDLLKNVVPYVADEIPKFTFHDYLFFIMLLILSAGIGVYFGFFQKKATTTATDDYLLGGKEMGVFEISMSLISSTISGLTILAIPSEIYRYGSSYWLNSLSGTCALIFSYFCVMPVFANLKTASIYDYLKLRFDETMRSISSILFTLTLLCFLPITIYIPALALSQATGFNIHYFTPLICCVCIFYTTVGGLKAVVWTDALQFVVMVGATLVVTYVGTESAGGFSKVWNTAKEGGRLDFDFDVDPTKRDTVWTNFVGLFIICSGMITYSQGFVQKCLALSNRQSTKLAYIAFGIGFVLFLTLSIYSGLLIYSKYHKCDLYTSKKIYSHDQVLPYYILDVTRNIPGLPGVFIAGIFSASLSTLSSAMNSLACTIYQDFISDYLPKDFKQSHVNIILKLIVIMVGVISTALVFVVQNFKSILEIGITFTNLIQGPLIGIFALGMFVPMANTKGALCGTIGSLIIMGWIVFTSLYYKSAGYIRYPTKDISVDECILAPNATFRISKTETSWNPPLIYKISHYYYGWMGTLLVFLFGIPISYFTRRGKLPVAKELISPVMHWAIKRDSKTIIHEYCTVEKANQMVTTATDAK